MEQKQYMNFIKRILWTGILQYSIKKIDNAQKPRPITRLIIE